MSFRAGTAFNNNIIYYEPERGNYIQQLTSASTCLPRLEGYVEMFWDHIDHCFDEDEDVFKHPRDPNRSYIPVADIRADEFDRSQKTTH